MVGLDKLVTVRCFNGQEQVIALDSGPIDMQLHRIIKQFDLKVDARQHFVLTMGTHDTSRRVRSLVDLNEARTLGMVVGLETLERLVDKRMHRLAGFIPQGGELLTTSDALKRLQDGLEGLFRAIHGDEACAAYAISQGSHRLIAAAIDATMPGDDDVVEAAMSCWCEMFVHRAKSIEALTILAKEDSGIAGPRFFRRLVQTLLGLGLDLEPPQGGQQGAEGAESKGEQVWVMAAAEHAGGVGAGNRRQPASTLYALMLVLEACPGFGRYVHAGIEGRYVVKDPKDSATNTACLYPHILAAVGCDNIFCFQEPSSVAEAFRRDAAKALLTALLATSCGSEAFHSELVHAIEMGDKHHLHAHCDDENTLVETLEDSSNLSRITLTLLKSAAAGAGALLASQLDYIGQAAVAEKITSLEKRNQTLSEINAALKDKLHSKDKALTAVAPFLQLPMSCRAIRDAVEHMLLCGWDNLHFHEGYTLLHYVAEYVKEPEVAELIFAFAHNPETKDKDGFTPLECARRRGNQEMVIKLQELYRAYDEDNFQVRAERRSPRELEALRKRLDGIQGVPSKLAERLREVVSKGPSAVEGPNGFSVMHFAAQAGSETAIRWLIDAGAGPYLAAPDALGLSPLDYAVQSKNADTVELIQQFLRDKIPWRCRMNSTAEATKAKNLALPRYPSSLEEATSELDREEVLRRAIANVLQHGWDNVKWPHDFSALHLAASQGTAPAVAYLLQVSGAAGLGLRDEKGKTPLDYASERKDDAAAEVVRLLGGGGEGDAALSATAAADREAAKASGVGGRADGEQKDPTPSGNSLSPPTSGGGAALTMASKMQRAVQRSISMNTLLKVKEINIKADLAAAAATEGTSAASSAKGAAGQLSKGAAAAGKKGAPPGGAAGKGAGTGEKAGGAEGAGVGAEGVDGPSAKGEGKKGGGAVRKGPEVGGEGGVTASTFAAAASGASGAAAVPEALRVPVPEALVVADMPMSIDSAIKVIEYLVANGADNTQKNLTMVLNGQSVAVGRVGRFMEHFCASIEVNKALEGWITKSPGDEAEVALENLEVVLAIAKELTQRRGAELLSIARKQGDMHARSDGEATIGEASSQPTETAPPLAERARAMEPDAAPPKASGGKGKGVPPQDISAKAAAIAAAAPPDPPPEAARGAEEATAKAPGAAPPKASGGKGEGAPPQDISAKAAAIAAAAAPPDPAPEAARGAEEATAKAPDAAPPKASGGKGEGAPPQHISAKAPAIAAAAAPPDPAPEAAKGAEEATAKAPDAAPPKASGGKGGGKAGGKSGGKAGGPPAPKANAPGGGKGNAAPKFEPRRPKCNPPNKMKKLHWKHLYFGRDAGLESTIWMDVQFYDNVLPAAKLACFEDVGKEAKEIGGEEKEEKKKGPDRIRVVEGKDVQPGEVGLRSCPPVNECYEAIQELDESKLTLDQLKILARFTMPKGQQLQTLQGMRELMPDVPFAVIEQYMWVLGHMPGIEERLKGWILCREINDSASFLLSKLRKSEYPIDCVIQSENFPRLLGIFLAVGNYINGGTDKGQADAIVMTDLSQGYTYRSPTSIPLNQVVFEVYWYLDRDGFADLLKELMPALINIKRSLVLEQAGTTKVVKNMMEDYEGLSTPIKNLKKDFEAARTEVFDFIKTIKDDSDTFKLLAPKMFERSASMVDELVNGKAEIEGKFKAWLRYLKLKDDMKPEGFFTELLDEFFVPKDKLSGLDANGLKNIGKPMFMSGKTFTPWDLLVLWKVIPFSEKDAAAQTRADRVPMPPLKERLVFDGTNLVLKEPARGSIPPKVDIRDTIDTAQKDGEGSRVQHINQNGTKEEGEKKDSDGSCDKKKVEENDQDSAPMKVEHGEKPGEEATAGVAAAASSAGGTSPVKAGGKSSSKGSAPRCPPTSAKGVGKASAKGALAKAGSEGPSLPAASESAAEAPGVAHSASGDPKEVSKASAAGPQAKGKGNGSSEPPAASDPAADASIAAPTSLTEVAPVLAQAESAPAPSPTPAAKAAAPAPVPTPPMPTPSRKTAAPAPVPAPTPAPKAPPPTPPTPKAVAPAPAAAPTEAPSSAPAAARTAQAPTPATPSAPAAASSPPTPTEAKGEVASSVAPAAGSATAAPAAASAASTSASSTTPAAPSAASSSASSSAAPAPAAKPEAKVPAEVTSIDAPAEVAAALSAVLGPGFAGAASSSKAPAQIQSSIFSSIGGGGKKDPKKEPKKEKQGGGGCGQQ